MQHYLYSIMQDVSASREIMFDATEIPHCLKPLDSTYFAADMKSLKAAHQYMKGSIPDKMYQNIKAQLQKYLMILLECHRQLLLVDQQEIEDDQTLRLYHYIKSYFSSLKQKFSFQYDSRQLSEYEEEILCPKSLQSEGLAY